MESVMQEHIEPPTGPLTKGHDYHIYQNLRVPLHTAKHFNVESSRVSAVVQKMKVLSKCNIYIDQGTRFPVARYLIFSRPFGE